MADSKQIVMHPDDEFWVSRTTAVKYHIPNYDPAKGGIFVAQCNKNIQLRAGSHTKAINVTHSLCKRCIKPNFKKRSQ